MQRTQLDPYTKQALHNLLIEALALTKLLEKKIPAKTTHDHFITLEHGLLILFSLAHLGMMLFYSSLFDEKITPEPKRVLTSSSFTLFHANCYSLPFPFNHARQFYNHQLDFSAIIQFVMKITSAMDTKYCDATTITPSIALLCYSLWQLLASEKNRSRLSNSLLNNEQKQKLKKIASDLKLGIAEHANLYSIIDALNKRVEFLAQPQNHKLVSTLFNPSHPNMPPKLHIKLKPTFIS